MDCAVLAQPYNHISFKRRKNTWYTVGSGNWTSGSTWVSNSHRRYDFPQTWDDVVIGMGHTVTFDTSASSTTVVNNLYIAGSFLTNNNNARTLNILGDLQVTGTFNLTSTAALTVNLFGVNNFIVNFTSGANSTISYAKTFDQPIMSLAYRNLSITGVFGTKTLLGDITVAGNFTNPAASFNSSSFNVTVTGSTSITNVGNVYTATGNGTHIFNGAFSLLGAASLNITGSPTFEFRGGIVANASVVNFGTSAISFTTSSQTISGSATITSLGVITIVGVITINVTGLLSAASIVGTSSSSTLNNSGTITNLTNGALPMASLGVYNYMFTNTSVVGFNFNGDYTLPYTTFSGLSIAGTGIKTLAGNSTFAYNVSAVTGTLELSSYDVSFGGTTATSSSGVISKTGAGNVVFVGQAGGTLAFTGNPTIELRGGFNGSVSSFGLGQVSFTTNNQTFTYGNNSISLNNPIVVSGAITLTIASGGGSLTLNDIINGNNAASTLDNRGTINYKATQQPMLTGVLQTNLAANTFLYNKAGDQNITGGTYRTLTLAGSGIKTLQGNVVVSTLYTLTPPATLNTNGFTRT